MDWQSMVPGCFGVVDRKFAGHDLEKGRAKAMVAAARESGASRDDVVKEVVWDCYNNGCGREHTDAQVRALGKYWPA